MESRKPGGQSTYGSRIYELVGGASSLNQATAISAAQTVRFCKFSAVKLADLLNLLPAESLNAFRQAAPCQRLRGQMVTCLMLTTETSFQVWYVAPTGAKQMNCLYSRLLPEVSQVDFVHLPDLLSVDQEITFGGAD